VLDPREAPKVFIAEGVRIEVAPVRSTLHPELTDRFFIRTMGTEEEGDGVVFVATREALGTGKIYSVVLHGQPRGLLTFFSRSNRRGWIHAARSFHVADIHLVEDFEAKLDPEDLLRRRRKQFASGLLARITPESRKGREEAQEKIFFEEMEKASDACGGFTSEINWSNVPDSIFENYSVAGECLAIASNLKNFCIHYPQAKPTIAKISNVRCDVQSHIKPKRDPGLAMQEDGTLVYSTGSYDDSRPNLVTKMTEAFGESIQVLRSKSHTLVVRANGGLPKIYASDGASTTYYPVVELSGVGYDFYTHLPSGSVQGALHASKGAWKLTCGKGEESLRVLVGAEREAVVSAATFEAQEKWKRIPYSLARDSLGTYYFVDRFGDEYGGKRYRVFIGRRGQLKLTKLKSLVEDSEGTMFSTDRGDLRLIIDGKKNKAVWIKGRKRTELTSVDVYRNHLLIYDDLGVYLGEDLGFICDD